jgi:Bacterial Ig-like domain (group 3)
VLGTETLAPAGVSKSVASLRLHASELAPGANTLTAVYSGNSVYGSSTSAPITVTLQ